MICRDFGAELAATIDAYHRWLSAETDTTPGKVVAVDEKVTLRQSLGEVRYPLRSATITRNACSESLPSFQYITDIVDKMSDKEADTLGQLLGDMGGELFFKMRLEQRVARVDNAIVLT